MSSEVSKHYLEEVRRQFEGYKRLGEAALAQLRDEDFLLTIDAESNSIAIIVKHITGNMRSRFTDFLTTDGEKPTRHRDQEFELISGITRAEVMQWWDNGWVIVFSAIDSLQADDLMRTVTIRNEPHTVFQALNRQLAHYALHIGQIVFLSKHLRSSEWKTLSIARGKSQDFQAVVDKYEKGILRK
jgi:hypothetical protein